MERETKFNPPGAPAAPGDATAWQRRISAHEVFEELLAGELRAGRLTAGGRRRIIAYGAQLGLTPAQVARMIERRRNEAIADDDPAARHHALRLVDPPPQRVPFAAKIALVITLAIAVDLLIIWALAA